MASEKTTRRAAPRSAPISGVVDLRPKRAPIDWDEAKRLYVEERLSFAEVGRRTQYSVHRVRTGLIEHGVQPRPQDGLDDEVSAKLRSQWRQMRRRCLDRTYGAYAHYGACGIMVCGEWDDFRLFRDWALAHGFEAGMSVVLKDRTGDYSPENCEIVSREECIARRFEHLPPPARHEVQAFGESKGAVEWSKDPRCRVPFATLTQRLAKGVPPEVAIAEPPNKTRSMPRSASASERAKRPPVDFVEARRLYLEERISLDVIAKRLGCSTGGIRAAFKRGGVTLRPRPAYGTMTGDGKKLYQVWANHLWRARTRFDEAPLEKCATTINLAWPNFESFRDWAIGAGWKPGLCVVRIDDSKPYSSENCRLVTRQEMARTRRPASIPPEALVFVTAFGETKGISAWTRDPRCRVTLATLRARLRGGIHPEDAITADPQAASMTGKYTRMLEAFGETKSLTQWAKDTRCRLTLGGLSHRLARGMTMEEALTEKPFRGYDLDSPNSNQRNSRTRD